jgi:outer membrane cobalamin receptor
MRNITITLLAFAIFVPVVQSQEISDTININEIFVKGSAVSSDVNGYWTTRVDTSAIKDHSLGDLSAIINENTPLFVKNYGPSGAATVSFRGSGASHTQLMWNDLSLNSPMLGQADLSLIPGGFVDEISVLSGGASMAAGSGGLGGLLSIKTKPEWKNDAGILLNIGMGSFGRYTGMMKFRAVGKKFQSVTRLFANSAINDFPYINTAGYAEPVKEYRKNSEVLQSSVMQEFYLRGRNSITTANAWYSYSDRNLPANILAPQLNYGENQVDNSFRTVLSHNRYLKNGGFEATLAWFNEYLRYINSTASIDSRNKSNTLFLKGVLQFPAGNKLDLKLMLLDEVNMVNTVNYNGFKSRNLLTLSASARREVGENLGLVFILRELMVDDKFISPDYSAAIDLELVKNSGSFLKMNFSRNSKVPTMNDLFWYPGGNSDLTNEYSYTGEVSLNIFRKPDDHNEFSSDLTLYTGRIMDMIQWRPTNMSYWTPENIESVASSGIETGLGYSYRINRTLVKVNLDYSYNRSRNLAGSDWQGKQLVYVPESQFNGSLRAGFRNLSGSMTGSFTGKRYTNVDNSDYLPGYFLINLSAGYSFRAGSNQFDLNLRADNILNENYEVIAWYPMPGRSFILSVTYKFTKK